MSVQVPAPAGDRWNRAPATPLDASAELDETLTGPLTVDDAAGAVIEPVGAVASAPKVIACVTVLPAASVPVMVYVPGALPVATQLKVVEVKGPAAGVVTVSAPWVVQLVALNAGNVADTAPEPPSV